MSAYSDVFIDALCDNFSRITLKIFTGCHIMQQLLVNAVFERIFPTPGSKICSLLCFSFSFSLLWVILWPYPFTAHSLLCRAPLSCLLHPVSPHPQPGFQLQSFLPSAVPPSPFPHVFPNAAVLACSVWLAGSRLQVKCQYNFFFLSSSLKEVPWNGIWTTKKFTSARKGLTCGSATK